MFFGNEDPTLILFTL